MSAPVLQPSGGDTKDSRPDASPPRDLVPAFAMRLREGVPELALAPPQQPPLRDFVASIRSRSSSCAAA